MRLLTLLIAFAASTAACTICDKGGVNCITFKDDLPPGSGGNSFACESGIVGAPPATRVEANLSCADSYAPSGPLDCSGSLTAWFADGESLSFAGSDLNIVRELGYDWGGSPLYAQYGPQAWLSIESAKALPLMGPGYVLHVELFVPMGSYRAGATLSFGPVGSPGVAAALVVAQGPAQYAHDFGGRYALGYPLEGPQGAQLTLRAAGVGTSFRLLAPLVMGYDEQQQLCADDGRIHY